MSFWMKNKLKYQLQHGAGSAGVTLPPSDSFSLPQDTPENSLPSFTTNSGSLGSRSNHSLTAYVDWGAWEAAWNALDEQQRQKFRSILVQPSPSASLKREKIEEEEAEECRSEAANASADLAAPNSGGTTPVSAPPAVGAPALSSFRAAEAPEGRAVTSSDSSEHYAAGDM